MGKASGGTRNYSKNAKVIAVRQSEYKGLINMGDYDSSHSLFDKSGGFVITHKGHNAITKPEDNKEDVAAKILAQHGYKIYLMSEKSYITGIKKYDGFTEHAMMDIKTINAIGPNTIKRALENAAKQAVEVVVLYQNTKDATRSYIESQLQDFRTKSPVKARQQIKTVIVVGSSGRVHRHKI